MRAPETHPPMLESSSHNLSTLLTDSARRHPALPALAVGATLRNDYRGARCASVARAAGALRGNVGCIPVIASRSSHRNCAEHTSRPMFAPRHAGKWRGPGKHQAPCRRSSPTSLPTAVRAAPSSMLPGHWRCPRSPIGRHALVRVGSSSARPEYGAPVRRAQPSTPAAVAPDAAAWLFYTSGTTGRPKGVVLTHAELRARPPCFLSDVESIAPGDVLPHPAPLSHGSGLYVIPHVLAERQSTSSRSRRPSTPPEVIDLLARYWGALRRSSPAPTMLKRADRASGDRKRAARSAEVHRVRRRPDVRRGLQGGLRGAGSPARADLRTGRVADDHHRDGPRAASPTPMARGDDARLGSVGHAATGHRGAHRRCRHGEHGTAGHDRRESARCWCAGRP